MTTLAHRSEIDYSETWDLTDLFETKEAWQEALYALQPAAEGITGFSGKLAERSENLLNCLEARESIMERIVLISTYATLKLSEDGTNAEAQADYAVATDILADVAASLSFIESDILSIPEKTIQHFSEEQQGLSKFSVLLEKILAKKPYALSAESEKVLQALNPTLTSPYAIYSASKSADMTFPSFIGADGEEKQLSFALFEDQYELSPDTEERRNAYKTFDATLAKYENTYAQTYATEVAKHVTLARLRNYESATDMLLHEQKVSQEMYTNQLDIIYQELAPHMQRFAKLKQRVLGLDELTFSDLKAPLDPSFQPETSYQQVSDLIQEALQVMGPEYSDMLNKALNERWVDRSSNIGKRTGAFCSSPFGAHPYILMTWTGNMRGAFMLAHELGHAGHFYLANQHQPLSSVRPSLYNIEAPSTMNELILGNHLLQSTDDPQMKRWVILQFLGTYYHNFVTHLLEGEFQRRVYELAEAGEPLTATTLRLTKNQVLEGFWGDSVMLDVGAGRTWMRQPHYYMGLYPYTYSAGLAASTAAYKQFETEGQPAIDRWLDMLKAGGSKSPLDLLSDAGVDMANPETIRTAVHYVGELITQLEESYAE
ncbi:oligoendopeptidase F [Alkalicoccobacillus murimartini]|uniref:Oligopeptidase F n=1 Tax=Alkalicoccobacillus murimartini TaxID=171685 RepID=A0ABT9YDU1_9BACI|nr:oligoendopeptidase F [Alkalicoccobacillus murimartini]MDQ0206013.1 oligoendopeptidase F [Alkalicoccobacillus murimartini]